MTTDPTWGVVTTIRAPARDILDFAAHYLELGAHRLFIYLDEDAPEARSALKRHPKCRVILTDDGYWTQRRRKQGRPERHQFRQSVNATHCYTRTPDVDWLLHADVDEFLLSEEPVAQHLKALPQQVVSARIRPIEALQSDPDDPQPDGGIWCKSFDPRIKIRQAQTKIIYPTFGAQLNGGMMSHVAGKVFVRTGLEGVSIRIHWVFLNGERDARFAELPDCHLVHLHADSWERWRRHFDYRLQHGSYRADLKGAAAGRDDAMTMHQLLSRIEQDGGEEALRAFYNEVCVATPDLRKRLEQNGHLFSVRLDLARKRHLHFPNVH